MCGRYVSVRSAPALSEFFQAPLVGDPLPPRYNVTPTQQVYTVRAARDGDGRILEPMKWGLVPNWARDPRIGNRLINARRETLASKPAFRSSLAKRRILVPSDGFFEWQRPDGGGRKTPFYFHRPDDAPIAFAGLGSAWKDDEGRWLLSCVIITTDANADMREVHDRMPVVLDQVVWDEWLAQEPLSESRLETLLVPPLSGQLEHYEISTAVNDVRNEGEELLAPVAAA